MATEGVESAGRAALLVVFDLDGVLARGDTMASLIQQRLLSHPLRAALGALPAAAWFVLHRFPAARIRLSRALGRIALSGMTAAQYRQLAVSVGARLGDDPGRRIADGVIAITRHLRDGDEVVVTTGTEHTVARAFLDQIGLRDVTLIATTIGFDRPGVRYENHNLGQQKAHNLGQRSIDLFYTDSDLDLPVALLSKRTILVNPDSRQTRLFTRHLANLTIVRWEEFAAS
jgi:phosphatidylglycerophosphatase C